MDLEKYRLHNYRIGNWRLKRHGLLKNNYYNEGLEYADWVPGYSIAVGGSLSKEIDHLYLYASNAAARVERTWVTDNAINLTNVGTLEIEWANEGVSFSANITRFIVSVDKMGDYEVLTKSINKTGPFARTTDTLDVSDLTGNYYLRIHARDNSAAYARTSLVRAYKVMAV